MREEGGAIRRWQEDAIAHDLTFCRGEVMLRRKRGENIRCPRLLHLSFARAQPMFIDVELCADCFDVLVCDRVSILLYPTDSTLP